MLGDVEGIWGIYLEDDLQPFDTSITVEFNSDSGFSNRLSLEGTGAVALPTSGSARLLRVGMRRFRVNRTPGRSTTARVTFTRRGPTYDTRFWNRDYRLTPGNWVNAGVGLFVPVQDVFVSRSAIDPIGGIRGATIVEDGSQQQLFIVGLAKWPLLRAKVDETSRTGVGSGATQLYRLVPNVTFGVGLPPISDPSYFIGANWPLGTDLFQLTAGVIVRAEEQLPDPLEIADNEGNVSGLQEVLNPRHRVVKPTIGVTIDFLSLTRQ